MLFASSETVTAVASDSKHRSYEENLNGGTQIRFLKIKCLTEQLERQYGQHS